MAMTPEQYAALMRTTGSGDSSHFWNAMGLQGVAPGSGDPREQQYHQLINQYGVGGTDYDPARDAQATAAMSGGPSELQINQGKMLKAAGYADPYENWKAPELPGMPGSAANASTGWSNTGTQPPAPGAPQPPAPPAAPGTTTGTTTNAADSANPLGTVPGAPAGTPVAPNPYTAPTRPADASTPFDFLNEQGLKFRLGQGMDQLQNTAAAAGGLQSGQTLKDLETFRQGVSSEEYGKAYDRYNQNRQFGEQQFQTDRNFGRGAYQDDRNFARQAGENDRDYARRILEQDRGYQTDVDRWNTTQGWNEMRDARDYQGDLDRWNSTQGYQREKDTLANDWQNKMFDYTARTGDRAFNAATLTDLAQRGLGGAQGDSQMQQQFMQQLMQSIMQSGVAGAQGGIGQGNNWMNLINTLFNQGTVKPKATA